MKIDNVQILKTSAQSIIDHAEQIIGDYPYYTGWEITIRINPEETGNITVKNSFYGEGMIKYLQDLGVEGNYMDEKRLDTTPIL